MDRFASRKRPEHPQYDLQHGAEEHGNHCTDIEKVISEQAIEPAHAKRAMPIVFAPKEDL